MPHTVFVTYHTVVDEVMFTAMEPTTGGFGAHLMTCPNTATDVDGIAGGISDTWPGAVFVAPFPRQIADIQCRAGLLRSGEAPASTASRGHS